MSAKRKRGTSKLGFNRKEERSVMPSAEQHEAKSRDSEREKIVSSKDISLDDKVLIQQNTKNFGRLVWDFLADRRCEAIHSSLGSLYTSPNFLDRYENHLRCCALLVRKPLAAKALSLTLATHEYDWDEPCKLFTSTLTWNKVAISESWLHEYSVLGSRIYAAVQEYMRTGSCANPLVQRFMSDHNWPRSIATIDNCAQKNTIWMLDASATRPRPKICVEGNKRMHSLAFKLQHVGSVDFGGWNAWIASQPDTTSADDSQISFIDRKR